jgi:uncharacterized protein
MSSDQDTSLLQRLDWDVVKAQLPEFSETLRHDKALLDRLGLQLKARTLIDFGPAALAQLEAKAMKDFDLRRQLESTARANFEAQSQTHLVSLSLLEARNLSDLARRLNTEVKARFGLVAASLGVEDTGPVPLGWKSLDEGGVDYILGHEETALLGPEAACRVLFDDDIKRIKSAATLRLNLWREQRPGLISFGSSEFGGFTSQMGSELVAFVARVCERICTRWPVV